MPASRKSGATEQTGLPAAEVVSFLRDTRSSPAWTEKEFTAALNLTSEQAKQTLPVLQLAGYIEPLGHAKWRTTEQGELLGGGKAPRFTQKSVQEALVGLKERIQAVNADESAPHRITRAVAFGDFLNDRVRVQAATVGIELRPRSAAEIRDRQTAATRAEESSFLKQLSARSTILHLKPYEPWMSHRSHRDLLDE
jgi:hypothetical protein